ncbi:MAG: hypothetical protein FWD17_17975, partial [Polyangiaceae bacterium]|nr:hypothetical protein [Polyangiaceae bacterium]
MSIERPYLHRVHRVRLGRGLAALALGIGAAASGCAGAKTRPPTSAEGAARAMPPGGRPSATEAQHSSSGAGRPSPGDAELVVHRDVVAQCPTLRLVRAHADEFDAEMIWLAVLEAIADCMREDGPLARQSLGVSGDEDHRHVVREVLASRGIAPTRV